jgi:hypothetical protein
MTQGSWVPHPQFLEGAGFDFCRRVQALRPLDPRNN